MSDEMTFFLWVVTWRERAMRASAWKVVDDGNYEINKPRRLEDELGSYWQVAVYAHNKMTAIMDSQLMINKEIQASENIYPKHHGNSRKR